MQKDARIYVAGHRGLVGSAICRELERQGFRNIVTRTHAEVDLCDWHAVSAFLEQERPEYVFLAAARVGGILANSAYPAEFLRENLLIQNNVLEMSRQVGVRRLLFLGSSCIYPKFAEQPIREEFFLGGPLEPTNQPYAIAKIAGVEACSAYNRQYGTRYLAAMPTNLYGPNDHFDLKNSHVLPALLRKVAEAKQQGSPEVEVWGTGTPRRELLYADDMAEACVYLMGLPDEVFSAFLQQGGPPLINIGTGEDLSIRELAELICRTVGYTGRLVFDRSKPDGTPRKLLDVSRLRSLGWQAHTTLEDGIARTWQAYQERDKQPPAL